jgi:hypothetical protein
VQKFKKSSGAKGLSVVSNYETLSLSHYLLHMVYITTLLVTLAQGSICRMPGKSGIGKDEELNSHGLV